MIEVGKVYFLELIGPKFVFTDKVWVVLDSERNTHNIPYYPLIEKLYKKGDKLPCKCTKLRKGEPEFDIDIHSIYKTIYKEGSTYQFKAEKICTDSSSFARYIQVSDEYGMYHQLYHPSSTDKGSIGQDIFCKVLEVKECSIVLESTTKTTTRKSTLSLEEQLELFNELHDRRVRSFEEFNQDDFKGVWENAIGLYPDSAHFIYELLQNADEIGRAHV